MTSQTTNLIKTTRLAKRLVHACRFCENAVLCQYSASYAYKVSVVAKEAVAAAVTCLDEICINSANASVIFSRVAYFQLICCLHRIVKH